MLTPKRHLICSLRKSDLCRCGCRGLCTLGEIQRIIAWSFNCIAKGEYPSVDHWGRPFEDEIREARRGTELAAGYCGALCEMRADLLEFCDACGFQRWSTLDMPCFCCFTPKAGLYDFPVVVAADHSDAWGSVRRDSKSYDEQVQASVFRIIVHNKEELDSLNAKLKFDFLDKGYGGKCLEIAHRGVPAGARLMHLGPVQDYRDLDDIETPATLTFFDTQGDHGLNFICPLFAVEGFSIESLALDVMHCLDLGIAQLVIGRVLRMLISGNAVRSTARRRAFRDQENLKMIRRKMKKFYKERPRDRGTKTEIGKMTMAMLGTRKSPRLKAKAAETRNLLELMPQLVRQFPWCFGTKFDMISRSVDSLLQVYQVMRSSRRRMSPEQLSELRENMCRHLFLWKLSGGKLVPKHHYSWHLVERADVNGNPRFSWTYTDEQENRVMGQVAKSLHDGKTFYIRFLQKVLPEVCMSRC